MPSKSPKQHRLMEIVAHDPEFAAKVGIPQKVGQEFADADRSRGLFGSKAKPEKPRVTHKAPKLFG